MKLKQFDAAIASVVSYLEMNLNHFLRSIHAEEFHHNNISTMVHRIRNLHLIDEIQEAQIKNWITIRNKIVHSNYHTTIDEGVEIVSGIENFVNDLRAIDPFVVSNWWYALRENERIRLTDIFHNTLVILAETRHKENDDLTFNALDVFRQADIRAYSDALIPMIVRVLRVQGKIQVLENNNENSLIKLKF